MAQEGGEVKPAHGLKEELDAILAEIDAVLPHEEVDVNDKKQAGRK